MRRLALLALLAVAAVAVSACGGSESRTPDPDRAATLIAPEKREAAEPFDVAGLDGGRITLRELRGAPVILNFWASWCEPCKEETPDLVAFSRRYPGIRVVGIATNDDPADSRGFAKRYSIPYALGSDPDGKVGIDRYGVPGLPATYVIDATGRVAIAPWFGPITRTDLDALGKALTAETG